jgi:hypothetical protein
MRPTYSQTSKDQPSPPMISLVPSAVRLGCIQHRESSIENPSPSVFSVVKSISFFLEKRQNETKWSSILSCANSTSIENSRLRASQSRTVCKHLVASERYLNFMRTANALLPNDLRCVATNRQKQNPKNLERQSVLSNDPDQRTFKMPLSNSRFLDRSACACHPQLSTLNPQPSFAFSEFRCKRRP